MKKLILLIGVSGSGKSTYVEKLKESIPDLVVASADHYFMKNGVYNFQPSRLGAAHQNSEQTAQTGMAKGLPVVVDNTNVQWDSIKTYLRQAAIFGYDVKFITFWAEDHHIPILVARNTHNVPQEVIERQFRNYKELLKNLKKNLRTDFPEIKYSITMVLIQETSNG